MGITYKVYLYRDWKIYIFEICFFHFTIYSLEIFLSNQSFNDRRYNSLVTPGPLSFGSSKQLIQRDAQSVQGEGFTEGSAGHPRRYQDHRLWWLWNLPQHILTFQYFQTRVMSPRITIFQLQGSEKWRVVFQVMWRQTAGSIVSSARPSLKASQPPPPSHRWMSQCTPNQGNLSFHRIHNCKGKAGFTGLWFPRLLECWIQPVHWQQRA